MNRQQTRKRKVSDEKYINNVSKTTRSNKAVKISEVNNSNSSISNLNTKIQITKTFNKLNDAVKYLSKFDVQKLIVNNGHILKFDITIDENLVELSSSQLSAVNKKFDKTSVLICLASKRNKNFEIYWKSNEIESILQILPYKDNFPLDQQCIRSLVADLIEISLKRGHLGIKRDHPIENGKIQLHNLADYQNHDLLLIASKLGNAKSIPFLLKCGFKPSGTDAQTLAYQRGHSDVLLKFLEANYEFPENFDINNVSDKLKKFVRMSLNFHKMIEARNKEKLQEVIDKNPNLKYFFNLSNESALKVALRQKLIDIYEFLVSKGISFAFKEHPESLWGELDEPSKKNIAQINFKYEKQTSERHLDTLMAHTTLTHDEPDEEGKRKLILDAYNTLNKNPLLKVILKTAAASVKFNILYDFFRDSTYRVDPTDSYNVKGTYDFTSNRIIIGAKQLLNPETNHITLGVIIHELCHLAFNTAYRNMANPYDPDDTKGEAKYTRIFGISKQLISNDDIIQSVFDYPIKDQHSELIVRPAQLMVHYEKKERKLKRITGVFNKLFDHFENVIIPELERALPEIEARFAYKPAQKFEQLKEHEKKKVKCGKAMYKCVAVDLKDLVTKNMEFYRSLTPEQISKLLNNEVLNLDDPYLTHLDKLIDLKWKSLPNSLKKQILNSTSNFQGQKVYLKILQTKIPKIFSSLTSQEFKEILVTGEIEIEEEFIFENEFYVDRIFIPEDAVLIRFEYKYGHMYNGDVKTKKVNDDAPLKQFKNFIAKFLQQSFEIRSEIYEKVRQNEEFLKHLTFNLYLEIFKIMHRNSKGIIKVAKQERIFILSSVAGAGKTATFENLAIKIKSSHPACWVSYINLTDHIDLYETSGVAENVQKLIEKMLNLTSKSKFIRKVFSESFITGNVFLIWNGFDEISPNYSEFVLNLIKFVYDNTRNVQFVCTRPLYSDQLSKAFKVRTWQLVPFNDERKREYIQKFFEFQKVPNAEIFEKIKNVEDIEQKFQFRKLPFYNFNTPLMLKLIAEIHDDKSISAFSNVFLIFDKFIEKKIEIWANRDRNSKNPAIILWRHRTNLNRIFQKHALLNSLLYLSFTTLGLKIRKLQIMQSELSGNLTMEGIADMGILYFNGGNKFEFVHRTFLEFFVAQYFIDNIYIADEYLDEQEAELRLEIFSMFISIFGYGIRIVIDFMNSYLELDIQNEKKKFNKSISQLLRTKFRNFFIRMLDRNHPEIYNFLFKFFQKDSELLAYLLHVNENETFYTAIFNPSHFGLFVNPGEIKNLARKFLSDVDYKKFVCGKKQKGKILFGMHFYQSILKNDLVDKHIDQTYRIEMPKNVNFWDLLDKINENLTQDERKELFKAIVSPKIYLYYSDKLFNFESSSCSDENPSDFHKYKNVWTNFENSLIDVEMQELLGNVLIEYLEIYPAEKTGHEIFLTFLLGKVRTFLSDLKIYELFITKSILHEAHWNLNDFKKLWEFVSTYTSLDQQKQILLQYDLNDKNFKNFNKNRFDEEKENISKYPYRYFHYDFTPFNIFHRSLVLSNLLLIPSETFDFTKEIYKNILEKNEIQNMLLNGSNDFIFYVIGAACNEDLSKFISFLGEIFEGNEISLIKLFERNVKPTYMPHFEYVKSFKGLSYSQINWFKNLEILTDFYDKLKKCKYSVKSN